MFFLDLPNQAERARIVEIQRRRNPADFNVDAVAKAATGYSGAEIESAIQAALYVAYSAKQQISMQYLLQAQQATVPLSRTRAEEIAALREWARAPAVPASIAEHNAQGA